MIRRRWSIPLAVLAVTGALALAAPFADATGTSTDLQRIEQSGPALIKSGSARFAGRVTISGASTTSGTVTLSGGFDFKDRQGQFDVDASALGASAGSGRLTFRLVNNVAYLNVGSFRSLTHGTLPPSSKASSGSRSTCRRSARAPARSSRPTPPRASTTSAGSPPSRTWDRSP